MKRKLKKSKWSNLSFFKKNILLIMLCFTLLSISSIAYSALNQELNITGDLVLRSIKDIRITSLELTSTNNEAYEQYNSKYTVDSVSLYVNLPNVGSTIIYKASIKNLGTVPMEIETLSSSLGSTSSGVIYTIDGIELGTVIEAGNTQEFTITLERTTNSTNKEVSFLLELSWIESIPPELYTDPILVGNDPNLLNDSLTPVIYNGTNWVVADTTEKWYDYSNQEWANAVILNSGVTKNVGDIVTVPTDTSTTTDVKAMYVWIPRYEYHIEGTYGKGGTSADLPGEIEVKFIPRSQTSADSNYILHPAFTWDNDSNGIIIASEHITGIWVGKFETTGDASTPTILPNISSLREQTVSAQFTTAQKFATYLTNSTNTDSHMMKNSEWGAVAYLSQSIYGKYGNTLYTGANKEVYKNVSSGHYTGRSSGKPSASGDSDAGTCLYNDITDRGDGTGSCGAGASTTGNITGVYDMSGGAVECTMGYLTTASSTWGAASSGNNAGFTSAPDSKYYDSYTSTTATTACNGGICYGHALSETSGWYSDLAGFVSANNPWFPRGGVYSRSTFAGVFLLLSSNGNASSSSASRSVLLTPGV